MTAHKTVKVTGRPSVVAVITTPGELRLAGKISHAPDLFELRLDHLSAIENEVERMIPHLGAPLIITARHPAEGGVNNLSAKRRLELLLRFLPHAQYLDVELRSAHAFRALLDLACRRQVRRIISFHDFRSTPTPRSLHAKAQKAKLR